MQDSIPSEIQKTFGSHTLDKMVEKLRSTSDPRRRYEYVLWLGKKLPSLSDEELEDSCKVKGCISQVYVVGKIVNKKLEWKGFSDALITKGLLALLIEGLHGLTPDEIIEIERGSYDQGI